MLCQEPARWSEHPQPLWLPLAMGLTVLLTGCAHYQLHPLTRGTVEQALAIPDIETLRIQAAKLHNPLLKPVKLNLHEGLTPDQAAVLAVLLNPTLRAVRDQRGLVRAQLLAAKVLPNPQISYSMDVPFGAHSAGNVTAYGLGLSYDITSLITRGARVSAAKQAVIQVDLDVAWREWKTAETAKTAVFNLISLQAQLAFWKAVDQRLEKNLALVRQAVQGHQSTILALSAARTASQNAHASYLSTLTAVRQQQLALKRALGLPAKAPVKLAPGAALPTHLSPPSPRQLLAGLARRRLDLIALRHGYQSQEQIVRAAILAQFPTLSLGVSSTRDFGNFPTLGPTLSLALPVFDRNQGAIATQRATRQKLFNEYINRIYQARMDIIQALEMIHSLNDQIATTQAAIPSLEQLARTYKKAVQQGNADVLSYYQARNNLARKHIHLLTLEQQLVDQWITLELAAGVYLPATTIEADTQKSEQAKDLSTEVDTP